jgi:hypothetical protein
VQLLDVPEDSWFVLTDISLPTHNNYEEMSPWSGYYPFSFQLGDGSPGAFTPRIDFNKLQWSADPLVEHPTAKSSFSWSSVRFQSTTGIAFRPGSKIQLLNVGSFKANVSWSLLGYYVRA